MSEKGWVKKGKGEKFVKSMGENVVNNMGEKRWVKKAWVKKMDEKVCVKIL